MLADVMTTPLPGIWELRIQPFKDHRGAFLNAFRMQDPAFQKVWGKRSIAQVNVSRTDVVGTVRGLHFQADPFSEAKLVRCIRGKIWDVVVDLRKESPCYGFWHGVELSPSKGNALFIPESCAHGFQVMEAESELLYIHSGVWVPNAETGIRWDDAKIGIDWPEPVTEISDRDLSLPILEVRS